MSVQNVVLAQLVRRRGYGYELAERLRGFSEALQLSETTVYAALKNLEDKGFIREVGRDEPSATRRRSNLRVIFDATPEGRLHLAEWMAAAPRKTALREELHMQLMVAEEEDIPGLILSLQELEAECRARVARTLELRLETRNSSCARISQFGAPLVQDGIVSHLQETLEWARRSRRTLLERIGEGEPGEPSGAPGRTRP